MQINSCIIRNLLCFLSILLCWIVVPNDVCAQSISKTHLKQAQKYYEDKLFDKALSLYEMGGAGTSSDPELRYQFAHCLYETGDVEGTLTVIRPVLNENKVNPSVYLLMAKAYQTKSDFTNAIQHFKTYLQVTKENAPERQWVKNEIVRSAYGLRLKHTDEIAFVENAGPVINTPANEIHVLTSPTIIDKIYFHSNRTDQNIPGNEKLYSTSILNGTWSTPTLLPEQINSSGSNQAIGFSSDGQILYFLNKTAGGRTFLADTFSASDNEIHQGEFSPPFGGKNEKFTDLTFFNDTIALFSAITPKGIGGYDLYISIKRNYEWTEPVNLGPAINTSFDERFPFLTKNGRKLFFSSNRLESSGGYDLFEAEFSDKESSWAPIKNLGYPINSPKDDVHFILAPDGMSGYLTSDRIGGEGGFDIYRILFKHPVLAHQKISSEPSFYHYLLNRGGSVSEALAMLPQAEKKEYYLSHLFLETSNEVLTPQNIKKLDILATLMQTYPNIHIELSGFQASSGQKLYDLYFSVKQAEKAAAYLINKGINRNRLWLKGYGTSFPILNNSHGMSSNSMLQRLSQRIELTPHNHHNDPVEIHVEKIQIPDNLTNPRHDKFMSLRHDLYFSVQIATASQMLQNADLESNEEMFIEANPQRNAYHYMIGWENNLESILSVQNEMIQLGFIQATIIPYLDGERLTRERMVQLQENYPQLKKLLASGS